MNRGIYILILVIILSILIYKKNKKIKGLIKRIERTHTWLREYFDKRYGCIYIKIKGYIKSILKVIICICFMIILLNYSSIVYLQYDSLKVGMNKNFTIDPSIMQQLVIVQISSTFLITAVLSLVANLENKYIFGEKALGRIFIGSKITFSKVFYLLIILMFTNIVMMISKGKDILMILNIFITFLILSWLTYRIIRLFLQVDTIKKELIVEYYYENKKVIKKSIPTKNYEAKKLDNLYRRYVELIERNDVEYKEINPIYLDLIDKTLFNNKKLYQEYFTEIIRKNDIITRYLDIIEILIYNDKIYDAIDYYRLLLTLLNYHNTYISEYRLFDIYRQITDFTYKCKDIIEFKNIIRKQQNISVLLLEQAYLCRISDLSFTRLANLNSLYVHKPSSRIFKDMYNSIFNNSNVCARDKQELYRTIYDNFRMSHFNLSNKFHDITTFKPKYTILEKRRIDTEIIGIQVAQLLLATIYNKDKDNFELFMRMNIDEEEMLLAKNISLLYIIYSKRYSGNIYSDYKDFDFESASGFITESKCFFKKFDDSKILKSVYSKIINLNDKNSIGGKFYSDEYTFTFSNTQIDMYFIALSEILSINDINFNTTCDQKSVEMLITVINKMMKKDTQHIKV